MLQALLSIFPYAPLGILFIDPHLPDWLPEIRLRDLHIGRAMADLQFYRCKEGSTSYRILNLRGKLRIVRPPSPWSLTTNIRDAVPTKPVVMITSRSPVSGR
jgi:hypothetical protein